MPSHRGGARTCRSKGLPASTGRVLIDVTNPLVETSPKLVLADPGDMSASEVVAALVPGARIVKACNSIVTARFIIKQLIESFGFTAIDLGGLATDGRLQQARGPLAGRDLVDFGSH